MKLLATLALSFVLGQIVADRAELRLVPQKDASISYKVTSSATESFTFQGQTIEAATETHRSYVLAVKSENTDGSIDATLTYGPISGKQTLPMGQAEIPFDSEKPPADNLNPLFAAVAKEKTLEAGLEVSLKLSRQSEVLEAKGLADGMKQRIETLTKGSPDAAGKTKAAVAKQTDEHSRRALSGVLPRLPKSAVAVGDEFTIEHGWHHCNQEVKCTECDQKAKVAKIDADTVTVTVTGEVPKLEGEADDKDLIEQFTIRGLTMTGTLVFSRKDGFLVSMNLEEELSVYQPSPAGVLPVTIKTTTRFERAS